MYRVFNFGKITWHVNILASSSKAFLADGDEEDDPMVLRCDWFSSARKDYSSAGSYCPHGTCGAWRAQFAFAIAPHFYILLVATNLPFCGKSHFTRDLPEISCQRARGASSASSASRQASHSSPDSSRYCPSQRKRRKGCSALLESLSIK